MNQEIKDRIEMINKGKIPKGYKKISLGIFPEEWVLKNLRDIGEISTGATPLRSNPEYFGGDIFWVKTTDLNNSYITDTEEKITEIALQETSVKLVKENSILVAMYGGFNQIGRTGLMKISGTTNQAISSFYVDEKEYNSEYVLHWLNAFRGYWKRLAGSSRKDPNITKKDVENFPIMKPSYDEQKKIASILSTWDRAIELKEKLIEQKKLQKKGLMQQLLTGEVRLPGFKSGWKEVRLGEVLKERKETGYPELELLAITSSKGVVRRTEVEIKDTSSEDKSSYKRILPNDIGYNTMRMWQGVSGVSKYEGIVSPAYTVLKPTNKVDSYFMGYLFKLPNIINLFRRYSQGLVNDTLNLKYNNFKVIKVGIPSDVDEQKAIAKILLDQDKEIELLEKNLEFLKQQKKGLMQLLLTGKVRVKV
jgi:type I restriction enzyme, S subunit